mmetsp:Transcript_18495/g.41647  ORF Transcript_18495/g.41647 Transcript_18495/m.41647 type:complete len:202 (+) Transcript_18495:586-1191(+)
MASCSSFTSIRSFLISSISTSIFNSLSCCSALARSKDARILSMLPWIANVWRYSVSSPRGRAASTKSVSSARASKCEKMSSCDSTGFRSSLVSQRPCRASCVRWTHPWTSSSIRRKSASISSRPCFPLSFAPRHFPSKQSSHAERRPTRLLPTDARHFCPSTTCTRRREASSSCCCRTDARSALCAPCCLSRSWYPVILCL